MIGAMVRRVLITRPRHDARRVADRLLERGFEPVLEPVLEIVAPQADVPLDLAAVQALLVTSANGVRALAAATAIRDLRVFAVGAASAEAARDCGFSSVEVAEGDVAQLAALVARRLDPKAGMLLHAAGNQVAGDLAGALEDRGFAVRRAVLYEAQARSALSESLCGDLRAGAIDTALFFSPRSAGVFVTLLEKAGLAGSAAAVEAVCLSAAAADALDALTWRRVLIAERPEQDALLALLDTPPGS